MEDEKNYNQSDYFKYRNEFSNENSYYYDDSNLDQKKYLINVGEPYKTNMSWRNFEYLIFKKKIKILKKPTSNLGWFWGEKTNTGDDLLYTFDKYNKLLEKKNVGENLTSEEQREKITERKQDLERVFEQKKWGKPPFKDPTQSTIEFKEKYPKIIKIYQEFIIMDNNKTPDKYLKYLFNEKGYYDKEVYDVLFKEMLDKYNFEKNLYDEKNRDFKNLSLYQIREQKEKAEKLDKIYFELKPLLEQKFKKNTFLRTYRTAILDAERKKETKIQKKIEEEKPEWQKRLDREDELRENRQKEKQAKIDEERRKQEEVRNEGARVFAEEKRRTEELQARQRELEMKKANEEIQNLNYKIIDASGRYAANVGKLRALEFKLEKFKKLETKKKELEKSLREKNLSIEKRQEISKQKTELNEKLANIDSLKNQVADLKSKIPSASVFEQEKTLRENEIEKLKKLNETSLREKNALFRSLELEKIKQEIAIREEQRYQEEQRQKQELKQAKIVFLKEKKIAERKLDELNVLTRNKNFQIMEIKKNEQDLIDQKKNLEKIKSMRESKLKEKKLQIENVKLRTLELQKEKLAAKQNTAEQQKLFQDSIERDIDELNLQKKLLLSLSSENKKILSNTKKEISARQLEIEKNIKLNLENIKLRENKILAEESKLKLDVFSTLSDVKEQTAIKLDIEKNLQNLKDEIIRKQDVSDLLSDTISQIADNEISEVEEYNSFLESEIEFKKKLADENLSLANYKEIVADEREDLIDRLEHVKSKKLKQIYNLREKAIDSQMKIILVEGAEDLKSNLFSLKYEIENLEKEKEISERKEDFAKFQSDNLKRELKLRKQEIELLKNIRLKVIETERRVAKNEARSAIEDIVKTIEKDERDSEVREKLDEIIDDVEDVRISQNARNALSHILDKIENKEIHDAAKEKLDFILGKIEVHDNIEESEKVLENIIYRVEDREVAKTIFMQLHYMLEYIDDEEYKKENYQDFFDYRQNIEDAESGDDYSIKSVDLEDEDFLENDELDNFISNVKKHISGEKKMEQFSKISEILDETRKLDSKLKMEENIEMKDRSQRVGPEGYEIGETSFDQFSDYNFFIDNIEDPGLKAKTRTFLGNIDGFEKEEEKIPKIKNAYKSAINSALWEDKLDLDYWDGNIILDEKAKFYYEQKVNNINTALGTDYGIHIDPADMKVREFLDIKLIETKSEKRGEINGYSYNGEKIISRNISRNFYFNYIKKPSACQRFIDELKSIINKTARSQIASESYFEGKSVKDCAAEYIGELREEQSYQIDSARNASEMRNALREANDIDNEIKNIKKNSSFKMRLKIFRRTLSWRFTKLLRLLWKHKGKSVTIIGSLILAGIGVLLNQLGVIAVVHNLKKAARSVKQYANDVHAMGKRIIENIQSFYKIPGTILGYGFIVLSIFLRIIYFLTRMSGTYSSAAIFGALGVTFEVLIYFDGSAEKLNEKVADAMEETGNFIENAGIRAQKYITKNSPEWYWGMPTREKSVLQIVESGATKMIYKIAQGTQKAGKKVEEASNTVRHSLWYLKIFLIVMIVSMILLFLRNNFL